MLLLKALCLASVSLLLFVVGTAILGAALQFSENYLGSSLYAMLLLIFTFLTYMFYDLML